MIEIFCGTGSGKTSAAVGRAIRASGHNIPVLFAQFQKDGTSGEIRALKKISGVQVEVCEEYFGFVIDMTEEQIEKTRLQNLRIMNNVESFCHDHLNNENISGVIVLDEILHSCKSGFIEQDDLVKLLKEYGDSFEIILTGSIENKELIDLADYVTYLTSYKHPYQLGINARKGIEF